MKQLEAVVAKSYSRPPIWPQPIQALVRTGEELRHVARLLVRLRHGEVVAVLSLEGFLLLGILE